MIREVMHAIYRMKFDCVLIFELFRRSFHDYFCKAGSGVQGTTDMIHLNLSSSSLRPRKLLLMQPVRQSRVLSQSWKVPIPFSLLFMSLPTCSSHDINLFPDVSAVAAHLVYVPTPTVPPMQLKSKKKFLHSTSENDSEHCKIHAGT